MTWNKDLISSRRLRHGRDRRLNDDDMLLACIQNDWFQSLVAELETLSPDHPMGRPRQHSYAVVALLHLCSSLTGSQKRGELFLAAPANWLTYKEVLREMFPHDPLLGDNASPPTRSVLRHLGNKFNWDFAGQLHHLLELSAWDCATIMKLGENEGTLLEPSRNAILFGDSVVIRSLSSFTSEDTAINPYTGERQQRRHDPDAQTFVTGDAKRVYGTAFAHISAFTDHPGEHITFGFRPIDQTGEMKEANVALEMAAHVKSAHPGFAALAWDKALRGVHIDRIWDLQLQPLVGVYDKTGLTTETVPLDTKTVNGIKVQLVSWKGAVSLLTSTGEKVVLEPTKLLMQPNKGGTVRAYGEYLIPEGSPCDTRLWGHTVRQRVNSCQTHGKSLGEYVRAIPPGTERWKNLYGIRFLAESLNNWFKNKLLPNQRARSIGKLRQWIDMIIMMLIRNTVSCELYKQRTKPDDVLRPLTS